MNLLKSELRYSAPFMNAKAMNEGEWANLTLKLVAIATSFERSEKCQISHLRSHTYHVVEIWLKSVRWILR